MSLSQARRAFSMIELVTVMVVIGVIVAIAVPRVGYASTRASIVSAKMSARNLQSAIEAAYYEYGTWPKSNLEDILGDVFSANPLAASGAPVLEIETGLNYNDVHPVDKTSSPADPDAGWWYNPESGSIRARVYEAKTGVLTIELYNEVNGTNIIGLGETKGVSSKGKSDAAAAAAAAADK
ncbi:MAG: type II secretion system protein [Phycisphaeraceae bacterium]|nr:type II secretion system protein [Phycisphaerales bacterium]MCB9859826.1 type II secretion system protein [Phycisphaeraceae bacterium]